MSFRREHHTHDSDMTLNGAGPEDVFWFEPEDVQAVINEVLADSFSKVMQDTSVVNRMLRLKNL